MGHDHDLSGNFERQILFFMCCSLDCLTRMLYVKLKARYTEPTLFSCVKKSSFRVFVSTRAANIVIMPLTV